MAGIGLASASWPVWRSMCPALCTLEAVINYYPFHIGDYAAHTSHLTWEEDIAYRRMLDWYYLNERSLPGDATKVARLIRMSKSMTAIQSVLSEFFVLADDGFHSKRADAELTSMIAKQEQQSTKDAHEADRLRRYRERRAEMFTALRSVGVVPAWDVSMKELQRLHDANCNAPETRTGALPDTDSQRLSLPTPTPTPTPTPIKTKTARKRADYSAAFAMFWSAYPNKDAKAAAAKAFDALAPSTDLLDELLAAVAAQRCWPKWTDEGGKYIPHASTWLNGKRWEDEPPRASTSAAVYETPRQSAAIDRVIEMSGGLLNARRSSRQPETIDADGNRSNFAALG